LVAPIPRPAKVGIDEVAIFCGRDRPIVPAPLVTVIWLEVPVILATVYPVPLPMSKVPLAGLVVPIPVPPLDRGSRPVQPRVNTLLDILPVTLESLDTDRGTLEPTPIEVEPPRDTEPPPVRPVPAVMVREELASSVLPISPLGRDTVPEETVRPVLNVPTPTTSRAVDGEVVPTPTLPRVVMLLVLVDGQRVVPDLVQNPRVPDEGIDVVRLLLASVYTAEEEAREDILTKLEKVAVEPTPRVPEADILAKEEEPVEVIAPEEIVPILSRLPEESIL